MNFSSCGTSGSDPGPNQWPARMRAWIAAGAVSVLVGGCAGLPDGGGGGGVGAESAAAETETAKSAGTASPEPAGTAFTAELLHDLLLAEIAEQRGQYETAITSISRAAHRTRDRKIIAQAIRLASRHKDYRRVSELSRLMAAINPRDFHNQLTLANAQFETGQGDEALKILINLARQQQGKDADHAEPALQSIAALLAQQPPQEILPRFRAAIEAWPENPELKLTAALLAFELGEDAAFREWIDQALRLRPGWESAGILKLIHLADFDPPQMPAFADDFLRAFPAATQFQIRYGELLLHADQPGASLAQLEAALQRDPQSPEALYASGLAYLKQDNLPKALRRLRKLLALHPHNDSARLTIADIEIRRGELAAAAAALDAVASPQYYLDAQAKLATVIAKRDGVEAGIRHLGGIRVRSEDEAIRIILEQDLLYRDFEQFERAKAVLDAGLRRIPGHPDLLYNRGLLAVQLNLLELHERDMRALINQQPDNAHAYNALGYTLADQTGRLDEALALITRALELLPNDPFILDSMGWVHFRIGNTGTAIEYLRRALAIKKDAEIAAHLGEALWVSGNKREAREIWEQGKEWAPDNATLLETLKRFSNESSSGARDFKGRPALPGGTEWAEWMPPASPTSPTVTAPGPRD